MPISSPDHVIPTLHRVSAVALGACAIVFGYLVVNAPVDSQQGVIQKILYIHAPCAMAAYLGFLLTAIGGGLYLWKRDDRPSREAWVTCPLERQWRRGHARGNRMPSSRTVADGSEHGQHVLGRRIALNIVDGIEDETSVLVEVFDALLHLLIHFVWRSKRDRLLCVNTTSPEHNVVAVPLFQLARIHAGG